MVQKIKELFCTQKSFRPGELGCWASHLALWCIAADHDSMTLIFEDDNQFYDSFTEVFQTMQLDLQECASSKEPVIVYLGGGSLSPMKAWFPKKDKGNPSTRVAHCVEGYRPKTFNSYAINRAMARQLLEEMNQCTSYKPVDVFMEHFLKKNPASWSQHVSPHICYSTPFWSTDIQLLSEMFGFKTIQ